MLASLNQKIALDPPVEGVSVAAQPLFDELYQQHFSFVWRNLRRLGVPTPLLDDAVQDVFLVVYRRLPDYEPLSPVRAWLFAIVAKVARLHRRTLARKSVTSAVEPDALIDSVVLGPEESLERVEATRLLERVLSSLDDDQREVLVMTDMEQMSGPEIAFVSGVSVNTVYSRLRAARKGFQQELDRLYAKLRRPQ